MLKNDWQLWLPWRSCKVSLWPALSYFNVSYKDGNLSCSLNGAGRLSLSLCCCGAADLLHTSLSGQEGLPCLGFPSGHALPQPLWVRGQVIDQLSANLIRRLNGVCILLKRAGKKWTETVQRSDCLLVVRHLYIILTCTQKIACY